MTDTHTAATLSALATAADDFKTLEAFKDGDRSERRAAIKRVKYIIASAMVDALEALPGDHATTAEIRGWFQSQGVSVPGYIFDRSAASSGLLKTVRINPGTFVPGTPNIAWAYDI